jgi:hypothetical protein
VTVLFGIVLAAATAFVVLSPLIRHVAAPLADGPDAVAELRELYALRDVAYETLRDLEFDFQSGKISEADYRELADRYKAEALAVVQRIGAAEGGIEAEPLRGGR